MRLLVIGAGGQLARSLAAEASPAADLSIVACGRPVADLAEPASIERAILRHCPDAVVNAAAYTSVDRAESEPAEAFEANARGAGRVAEAAAARRLPLIHVSTDYVFAGDAARPYREDDPTGPRSAYGRSKLAGEEAVQAANPDHAILRTAWLYSPWGGNFVKTMLRLASERDTLRVVNDQHGNPTYAPDLAAAIVAVARKMLAEPDNPALRGTFHAAGPEPATWFGLAREIMAASEALGGPFVSTLMPIGSADYPTPAERPRNSRLDTGRLEAAFGIRLPPRSVSLWKCVAQLLLDGTVATRRRTAEVSRTAAPRPAEARP